MTHHDDIHGAPILREMVALTGFDPSDYAITDMVEFIGPCASKVGDVPYVTLTQYGVKEEGASMYPDDTIRCWSEAQAMWWFRRTFIAYLKANPARQIAWRSKPRVEQGAEGDFVVRCRFALLGEARVGLQAVA